MDDGFVTQTPPDNTESATALPPSDNPQSSVPVGVATQAPPNKTESATALPPSDNPQSSVPVGVITSGILGGFVLVLLIAGFILLRRRQSMAAQPQPLPELEFTPIGELEVQPPKLQEYGPHELRSDSRSIAELPSPSERWRDNAVVGQDNVAC